MDISSDVMIGLTSAQLALYFILFCFCVWKLALSSNYHVDFMKMFFAILLIYIIWELSLQIYQLIDEVSASKPNMFVMIGMNTECIIVEVYILFLLAYYWKTTKNLLRNEGRQTYFQPSNSLKYQIIPAFIWTLLYSAFFIYFTVQNYYQMTMPALILYVGQGITGLLSIWAIITQTTHGLSLLKILNEYESMIQMSLNKQKFILIVWMTSVINVARLIFLLFITFFYLRQNAQSQESWVALYIYSFTALVPISFYLIGFSVKEEEVETDSISSRNKTNSKSSKHETELSSSGRYS